MPGAQLLPAEEFGPFAGLKFMEFLSPQVVRDESTPMGVTKETYGGSALEAFKAFRNGLHFGVQFSTFRFTNRIQA